VSSSYWRSIGKIRVSSILGRATRGDPGARDGPVANSPLAHSSDKRREKESAAVRDELTEGLDRGVRSVRIELFRLPIPPLT